MGLVGVSPTILGNPPLLGTGTKKYGIPKRLPASQIHHRITTFQRQFQELTDLSTDFSTMKMGPTFFGVENMGYPPEV